MIRIKAPREGATTIHDAVQGDVTLQNDQLDDMVLLRADGTPLYMLAVVVDDHDMGVTHVIRGDDHLTNAFRQKMIFDAMGWEVPVMAHVPLIFGPDGKKLSKRHGATATADYQAMGYLASAMRNYLARLGWSHGDLEVFDDAEAMAAFDLVRHRQGAGPLRLQEAREPVGPAHGAQPTTTRCWPRPRRSSPPPGSRRSAPSATGFRAAIPVVQGARQDPAATPRPGALRPGRAARGARREGRAALDPVSIGILADLTPHLRNASWERDVLEGIVASGAEAQGSSLGKLAGPLRAALAGRTVAPSVFDMMLVLGREETLARLDDAFGAR